MNDIQSTVLRSDVKLPSGCESRKIISKCSNHQRDNCCDTTKIYTFLANNNFSIRPFRTVELMDGIVEAWFMREYFYKFNSFNNDLCGLRCYRVDSSESLIDRLNSEIFFDCSSNLNNLNQTLGEGGELNRLVELNVKLNNMDLNLNLREDGKSNNVSVGLDKPVDHSSLCEDSASGILSGVSGDAPVVMGGITLMSRNCLHNSKPEFNLSHSYGSLSGILQKREFCLQILIEMEAKCRLISIRNYYRVSPNAMDDLHLTPNKNFVIKISNYTPVLGIASLGLFEMSMLSDVDSLSDFLTSLLDMDLFLFDYYHEFESYEFSGVQCCDLFKRYPTAFALIPQYVHDDIIRYSSHPRILYQFWCKSISIMQYCGLDISVTACYSSDTSVELQSQIGLEMNHKMDDSVTEAIDGLQGGISDLCDKIGDIQENGLKHTFTEDFSNIIRKFCESLSSLATTVQGTTQQVNEITTSIIDKLNSSKSFIAKLCIGLTLSALTYYLSKNRSAVVSNMLSVLSGIAPLFLPDCVMQYLTGMSSQSGIASALSGTVLAIVAACMSMKVPSAKDVSDFISKCGIYKKKHEGLSECFRIVLEYGQKAVNWIRTSLFGLSPVYCLGSLEPEVVKWCEQVQEISTMTYNKKFTINTVNGQRVHQLHIEGLKLSTKFKNYKEASGVRAALNFHMTLVNKLLTPFNNANLIGRSPRAVPLAILLSGESGVGKTFATLPLLNFVMSRVLDACDRRLLGSNWSNFVYTRQKEMEFWDGYNGQFCTVYDDFCQVRDSVGDGGGEAMEIIRMVNLWPANCHMASMEEKANTIFMSRIVLASTNLPELKFKSIVQPEAVKRRFAIQVTVCVTKEFSTPETVNNEPKYRKLDHSKIDKPFDPEIYEFHTSVNGKDPEVMNFIRLVDVIVHQYNENQKQGAEYISYCNKIALDNLAEDLTDEDPRDEESPDEDFPKSIDDILNFKPKFDPVLALHKHCVTKFDKVRKCGEFRSYFRKNAPWFLNVEEEQLKLAMEKILIVPQFRKFIKPTYVWLPDLPDFSKHMESIKNFFIKVGTFVREHSGKLMIAAGCLSALTLAFSFSSIFSRSEEAQIEDCENQRGGKYNDNSQPRQVRLHRDNVLSSQISLDPNASEMLEKVLAGNFYELSITNWSPFGGCVALADRIFVTNKHFVRHIKEINSRNQVEELVLTSLSGDKIKISYEDFMLYDGKFSCSVNDYHVFVVSEKYRSHRNISNYWVKDSSVPYLERKEICLAKAGPKFKTYYTSTCIKTTDQVVDRGASQYLIKDGIQYKANTVKGDCGSIVLVTDPAIGANKFVGLHSAGNPIQQIGSCGILSYTDVMEILSEFDLTSQSGGMPSDIIGNFTYVRDDKPVNMPGTSKIRRSDLHSMWGAARCKPAVLRPRDFGFGVVDPKHIAISKYGGEVVTIDQDVLDVSANHYYKKISIDNPTNRMVFDFDIAVKGLPGMHYCDSICRKTSAGYPHVLETHRGFNGKQWFFGTADEFDLTSPQCVALKKRVYDHIDSLKKGLRPEFIFLDALKDERRPIEKVNQGKTRLISACPLELTILTRMYFLDFSMHFMKNHVYNGSAVGLNVYSPMWDVLAKKLKSRGDKVIAGDFSNFDGSLLPQVLDKVLDLINRWYDDGEENSNIRRNLWREVTNSLHICDNVVYYWNKGLPSGHPMTTIINTVYNNLAFRMCWIKIFNSLHSIENFDDHVEFIAYGDDNLANISDMVIDKFNQVEITNAMATFGLVYTDDKKTDEIVPFRSLSEVQFLKRGFLYNVELDRYLCPLDINTVLEIPYWTKKGVAAYSITIGNVDVTLLELSLHGVDVFNKHTDQILPIVKDEMGYVPNIVNYNACLHKVLSLEASW